MGLGLGLGLGLERARATGARPEAWRAADASEMAPS